MAFDRKIVAWARWHFPRPLTEDERKQDGDPDLFDQVIPEGSNKTLCEDLFAKLEWAEHTFVDREHGIFLNYLIVHPSYQGLGLSKKLLKVGLDEADRRGASCFVVSTIAGEGVYKKFGFKEIDRFVIDTRPWGGEEVPWFCMRREATCIKPESELRN
jgi:GNAT superfamily N-acetyltransferase